MKISEYVAALQAIQATEGDIDVYSHCPYAPLHSVRPASSPEISATRAKTKREQYEKKVSRHAEDNCAVEKKIVLV